MSLLEAMGAGEERLSPEEKKVLLNEAQGTTAWIFDYIKEICKEHEV